MKTFYAFLWVSVMVLGMLAGTAAGEAAAPARKIIIDTDTGADDASALILAAKSPAVEILGVTVLAGNGKRGGDAFKAVFRVRQG